MGVEAVESPTVVMTFVFETLRVARQREYCRPADRGMLALARSPQIGRLIVTDPWRSWWVDLLKRRDMRARHHETVPGGSFLHLTPRRLRRGDPGDLESLIAESRRYARRIGELAGLSAANRAVLVTYDPFIAGYADAEWISRKIYVGEDDHSYGARTAERAEAIRSSYQAIAADCDVVFNVSEELTRRVAPERGRTLPNGVDEVLWAPRTTEDDNVWRARGRYAVYAGSVQNRVDDSLFLEILKVVPEVIIAGPLFEADQKARLEAMPGVTLLGNLSQLDLVKVVTGASLGVIPHHVTPSTLAMSPLKMYEYLAAGLPVVATDIPSMRDGGERVLLCSERDEWAPATARALQMGVAGAAERLMTLERVGWDARLSELVSAVVDPSISARPRTRKD